MPPPADSPELGNTDGLDQNVVDEVVQRPPLGALAVAGTSTFIVLAIVILFYFFVYLPRGIVQ